MAEEKTIRTPGELLYKFNEAVWAKGPTGMVSVKGVYGWNIRNHVSHGLLATGNFNYGLADRVVRAFLLLSVFHLQEKKTETPVPKSQE